MQKSKEFEFINTMWNRVVVDVAIPISQEPDTEKELKDIDLLSHKIHRFPFNPEEEDISLTPSFLFRPMSSAELKEHPISDDFVESTTFVEYNALTPEFVRENAWDVEASAREACGLVTEWTAHGVLESLPAGCPEFFSYRGLCGMSIPNPFFLASGGIDGTAWETGVWAPDTMLEVPGADGQPLCPHVIMTVIQGHHGHDGAILYGELATVISAMRARANQPKVEEEDKEALFEEGRAIFPERRRAFAKEKRFPAMMLSFVGPQHGRIFYACLDGENLVIYQPKLYSFETKKGVNIELFARYLLSRPVAT